MINIIDITYIWFYLTNMIELLIGGLANRRKKIFFLVFIIDVVFVVESIVEFFSLSLSLLLLLLILLSVHQSFFSSLSLSLEITLFLFLCEEKEILLLLL